MDIRHEEELIGKATRDMLTDFHKEEKLGKRKSCKSHGKDCKTCDVACDYREGSEMI